MGVYALFLTGSNFVAPLIAGFINDGQDWKWVLVHISPYLKTECQRLTFCRSKYWCAIFCGIGFVFCFLFMEETNYDRKYPELLQPEETVENSAGETSPSQEGDPEKSPTAKSSPSPAPSTRAGAALSKPRKTFVQKIALFRREDLHKKNKLKGMILRPLIFLTFPVIFEAGFMYGSILCYFNVLNGTTSLILAGRPYNFSSSMVGLTYVACLLGISIG